MNKLLLIFIIFNCLQLNNGSKICDSVINSITKSTGFCFDGHFQPNKVISNNYIKIPSVPPTFIKTINVTPPLGISVGNISEYLISSAVPNVNYAVTFLLDGETDPCTYNFVFDDTTIYLKVEHSQCFVGTGNLVTILSGFESIDIDVGDGVITAENGESIPSSIGSHYVDLVSELQCIGAQFDIVPINTLNPIQYQLNRSTCPPTLKLLNTSTYTNIQVYASDESLLTATKGVYNVVYNQTYTIIAQSQTCGQQYQEIFVEANIPQVYGAVDLTCPSAQLAMFTMENTSTLTDFKILYNGNEVQINKLFKLVVQENMLNIGYTIEYCSLEFKNILRYDGVSIAPFSHTITYPSTCDETVLPYVTLHFDPEYVQPGYSYGEGGYINVTGFYAEYNQQYSIMDTKCFTNTYGYFLYVNRQFPLFELVTSKNDICFENYTVKIHNHNFFSQVYIDIYNGKINMDSEGYISVPKDYYLLKYVDKCGNYDEVSFNGLRSGDQNYSMVKFNITYLHEYNCDEGKPYISLNLTVYTDDFGANEPITIEGQPGDQYQDYYSRNLCDYYYTFNFPSQYKHNQLNKPGNNTCNINKSGVWNISNTFANSLYIDDVLFDINSGELTGYSNGTYNVTFNYGNPLCSYSSQITFGNDEIVDIPLEISYPTYCRTPNDEFEYNGGIKVLDYQDYTNVQLSQGRITYNGVDGNYSNLQQGTYILSVIKGTCNGQIEIPLYDQVKMIDVEVFRTPTCYNNGYGDGILKITSEYLNIQNDLVMLGYQQFIGNQYLMAVGSGKKTISFQYSNSDLQECNFSYEYIIPEEDPKIKTQVVTDRYSIYIGETVGYTVNITSENPHVTINSVKTTSGTIALQPIDSPIEPIYVYNIQSQNVNFTITFNDYCQFNYSFENKNEVLVPEYEIVKECGDRLKASVYVKNANQFESLYIADYQYQYSIGPDGWFRDVYVYLYQPIIYFYNKKNNIYSSAPFSINDSIIEYEISPMPQIKYTLESCYGSRDGSIEVLDSSTRYKYYLTLNNYVNDYEQESFNNKKFVQITAGTYILAQLDTKNPSCVRYSKVNLPGNDPEFLLKPNDLCTPDATHGSISASIKSTNPIANITYEFNSINSTSGFFDNIEIGEYSVSSHIDNFWCERNYISDVSIGKSSLIEPSSSDCGSINVYSNPSQGSAQVFVESSELGYKSNITTADSYVFEDLEPSTYKVTTITPTCNVTSSIVVDPCEDKKSNIGLIVGLAVGIPVALLIGFLVYMLYRRKRIKAPKVKPEMMKMETVQIFTGGKVGKLDEF